MLTCTKCGRLLEEEEFPREKRNTKRNGRASWCKECFKKKQKEYMQTEQGKAKRAEAQRKYRARPEVKEKQDARVLVSLMVKCGMIVKPDACECCGKKARLFGHHHKGYAHEHWADVIWVCQECHTKLDSKEVTDGLS